MSQCLTLPVSNQPGTQNAKVRLSKHYDHVELWVLRLLTSFDSCLYDPWDEDRELWLEIAGLPNKIIKSKDDRKIKALLQRRLTEIEAGALDSRGPLFANLGYLANVLALSPVEVQVLTFAAIATANHSLRGGLRAMNMGTREFAIQVLQCALQLPESAVRVACQKKAALSDAGLLFNQNNYYMEVEELLNLDDSLAQHFFSEHESQASFMSQFFAPAPCSQLVAKDYPHLDRDYRVLTGYLRHAVESRQRGVNILIYGPPGTGKTQFARVLADSLGVTLYDVGYRKDGDRPRWQIPKRLVSYQMCQAFLSRSHAGMVVFEEIEDVFPSEGSMFDRKREQFMGDKAEINSLLEQNSLPTIWISNDVSYLDPAYLRRFDYSLELLPPPRSVRRNIVQRYFVDVPIPAAYLDHLVEHEELTPAQVQTVAKVVRLSGISDTQELGKAVERMIGNSMALMGQARMPQKSSVTVDFGIEFLNVETPIAKLIAGMKQSTSCRVCLYGPPGTGKSSLGSHFAKALDRPLMVRRASDLLGSYVGQTEQHIAKMFRCARDENAVLFLDEADSFLRDRQEAHQSWEVTQVNELLTQMEGFDGIFVCATNRMDRLDLASLRRFDFKVRFDYLNRQQRWKLFVQSINAIGYRHLADEEIALRRSLDNLNNLTPGDFAVVSRRIQILGIKALPSLFIAALVEECKGKPDSGANRIGFV